MLLRRHHLILAKCSDISFRKRTLTNTDCTELIIENHGDKGVLTLNRPKVFNVLSSSMCFRLLEVLRMWEQHKSCVIIKGAGGRAFSAGGDVREAASNLKKGNEDFVRDAFRKMYVTNELLGRYSIPFVALIDGITMGSGVGISVHGRYRVATERTVVAMPEAQIGLCPDVGVTHVFPRLNGRLGWYLALTGAHLRGLDVCRAGIATHYTESRNLPSLEDALLRCNNEKEIRETLDGYGGHDSRIPPLKDNWEQIDSCFSASSVEEIVENLKQDGSRWAMDTVKKLSRMCPTSLKVTFKEMGLGRMMSLRECLRMEYRVTLRNLVNANFFEGVRALLIDKDQNPKWNPSKLEEVSEDLVDSYLQKLPEDQELF